MKSGGDKILIKDKHPLAIRWFHWINFPILAIMLWSGLRIYWANDVYNVKIGGAKIFHFFPEGFYNALNIQSHLAAGMAWHFVFMWLFIINGLLYVLYTMFSGEWRYLLPNKKSFGEAWKTILYDFKISKEKPVIEKYNGAQQIAYTGIIIMGIGSMLSGLAIYKPIQFSWLASALGGYKAARVEHFILAIGYVLFFLVHVIQVIRAGWNNFRAMVAGFEVVRNKKTSG